LIAVTSNHSRAALFLLLLAGAASLPLPAGAQTRFESYPSRERLLAGNVLIGTFTAGAGALIGRHPLLPALAKGAAGGAVAYAGRYIISQEGPWAAWTGRQVGAVGASAVRNASRGRSAISELVLPVGPVRLHIVPATKSVQPRVDLAGLVSFVVIGLGRNTTFDLSASARSGAMIFRQNPRYEAAPGVHRAGVLRIDNLPLFATRNGQEFTEIGVTTHELIHAAQYDFASIAWGIPLERALVDWTKIGKGFSKYVDFGLIVPLWGIANGLASPRDRPWEREANSLAPGG
jgi:hypothetical protein